MACTPKSPPPNKTKKTLTAKHRAAISKGKTGEKLTTSHKEAISKSLTGKSRCTKKKRNG